MGQIFEIPPESPQEAMALLCQNALSSDEIVKCADVWLSEGIFADELSEIFFEGDLTLEEYAMIFRKALVKLGARILTEKEAAYYLANRALTRALSAELALEKAADYIFSLYLRYDEEGDEFGASMDAGDLLAAYLQWEDSMSLPSRPPRFQARCYKDMRKAAAKWVEEHPV